MKACREAFPKAFDPKDVAICTIHGNSPHYAGSFASQYPWPRLQIEQLRRHTPAGYTVYAYGNRLMDEHAAYLRSCPEVTYISGQDIPNGYFEHVWPLRNWLARRAMQQHRYIAHLDSDAFPVRDDWMTRYVSGLSRRCPVVAVQRRENGDTHSDRSFLMYARRGFRRHAFDFSKVGVVDSGAGISAHLEAQGLTWKALLRSNAYDFHPLIAGIYDDRIYHHAAGSRQPRFRLNQAHWNDEAFWAREQHIHRILMKQLFDDTDAFLRQLRGLEKPFDLEAALARDMAGDANVE